MGASAGEDVSTGTGNTLIGDKAGNTGTNDLTTGTLNTLLGQLTAVSASGATNQTVIGRGVTGQADNSVTLGNSSVTKVYVGAGGADQSIVFKDSAEQGKIRYDHNNEQFQIFVGGSEKIKFESGGDIRLLDGGINFPDDASSSASSDANTLDDYEEGEYTVVITPSTSGSISLNAGQNTGSYTKIGNLVHVNFKVDLETVSSPVGFFTVGLPFTIGDGTHESKRFTGSVAVTGSTANVSDFVVIGIEGEGGARVYLGDGTALAGDSADALQNGNDLYLSVTYQV